MSIFPGVFPPILDFSRPNGFIYPKKIKPISLNGEDPSGLNFFLNAADKTPTTTGAYVDVDVSGDGVPSGSTGVILDIHNTSTTAYTVDVRKNGSTDNFSGQYISGTCHFYVIIGVDANRIFEAYISNAAVKIYLKGYTDSYVVLFTNHIDKSTGTTGSYVDTDVSADVSADATGVILRVKSGNSAAYAYAIRKNGSTDDRYKNIGGYKQYFVFIGIDTSKIFEQKIAITDIDVFLAGYTKPPVTFFTNAIDKSLTTITAWVDIDLTVDTEAIADGSIWEIVNIDTATKRYGEFRKNGSSDNHSASGKLEANTHVWALAGLDAENICEGIIETTSVDFYLIGYCKPAVTTYAKTYNADTLLKKPNIAKTYPSDVLLKKPNITKAYSADLLLKKSDLTKIYSTDILLLKTTLKTYLADILLKKTDLTKTYSADVLLLLAQTKTYSADVLLKKLDATKTYSSDVLLKKSDIAKTYPADVITVLRLIKDYSADVLLKKPDLSKAYSADVLLKKSDLLKAYSADVLLLKSFSKTYSADLLLMKSLTKTYAADVILYMPFYGIIHSELSMLERGMSFAMKEISQKIELVQRTMKIALHEIKQKLEGLERKMKMEAVAE